MMTGRAFGFVVVLWNPLSGAQRRQLIVGLERRPSKMECECLFPPRSTSRCQVMRQRLFSMGRIISQLDVRDCAIWKTNVGVKSWPTSVVVVMVMMGEEEEMDCLLGHGNVFPDAGLGREGGRSSIVLYGAQQQW
jgi:hypothetical protein